VPDDSGTGTRSESFAGVEHLPVRIG